jgi:hypothetical protein
MCREQRGRAVHDVHALTRQPRQAPKPGFDPVERRQDVEARNRDGRLASGATP